MQKLYLDCDGVILDTVSKKIKANTYIFFILSHILFYQKRA